MSLNFTPLESLFDRIDQLVNKDGVASKDELTLVFGEHAAEFLKFCDGDGDSKLTKEEFITGIKGDTEGMSEKEFQKDWVERMESVVKAAEEKAAAASNRLNIALLGGGSSCHVIGAMIQSKHNVKALLLPQELESWTGEMTCKINADREEDVVVVSGAVEGTTDPETAVADADVVIMCGPISVYPIWCKAVAPFLKPDVLFGAMYLQAYHMPRFCAGLGFPNNTSYFGFQLYPYASRVTKFGAAVTVLRPKVFATVWSGPSAKSDRWTRDSILGFLGDMLVVPKDLRPLDHPLGCILNTTNATIHPARMSQIYKAWTDDASTWNPEEIPFFYEDFDEPSAASCERVNQEALAIRDAIAAKYPGLAPALAQVKSWFELFDSYGSGVTDHSSLLAKFNSNMGYKGVTTPVDPIEGTDLVKCPVKHRYFQDDIPMGLLVFHLLGEMFQVLTPESDRLIVWAQKIMGKEYLTAEGKMEGAADAKDCPIYGYTEEEIVSAKW